MKISTIVNKTVRMTKKNAPAILTVIGGVGAVVGFVMGCKASTKLKDTVDISKQEIEAVRANEHATTKDLVKSYAKAGGRMIKLYAAPVAIEALSIAAMVGSNYILKKRNAGLAAALATTTSAFSQYRARVRGRFGDDVDRELRYGIHKGTFEETLTDENGNEITKEVDYDVVDQSASDDCTFYFDHSNPNWSDEGDELTYAEFYLAQIQQWADDLLKARGSTGEPLFLSEVLKQLCIRPTKASQFLGWIYKPDDKDHVGDNFIDFRPKVVKRRNLEGEYETAILLDFNCDGSVMDELD